MGNSPNRIAALNAEAEKKAGLPAGTLSRINKKEIGNNTKFIDDPAAYHYPKNAEGKRIAKHSGVVSTAFGPYGIVESTAAKPGYGVTPLRNKSLEEQARFAAEYLAARVKQAGSLEKGLAGYGEGTKYAQDVMKGLGVRPSPQQLQQVQVQPPPQAQTEQPRVVAQNPSPMQAFEGTVSQAPTMSYRDQVAQEMEAFMSMGQPKSEVEALMMAQAQQEAEAQQAMQARAQAQVPAQEDSFMSAFYNAVPQTGMTPFEGFSPYSAFNAWGRG